MAYYPAIVLNLIRFYDYFHINEAVYKATKEDLQSFYNDYTHDLFKEIPFTRAERSEVITNMNKLNSEDYEPYFEKLQTEMNLFKVVASSKK